MNTHAIGETQDWELNMLKLLMKKT
jgi:hypothetical protein